MILYYVSLTIWSLFISLSSHLVLSFCTLTLSTFLNYALLSSLVTFFELFTVDNLFQLLKRVVYLFIYGWCNFLITFLFCYYKNFYFVYRIIIPSWRILSLITLYFLILQTDISLPFINISFYVLMSVYQFVFF